MKKFFVMGLILGVSCSAFAAKDTPVALSNQGDINLAKTDGSVAVSGDYSLTNAGGPANLSTTSSNVGDFWAEQQISELKAQNLPIPEYLRNAVLQHYGTPKFDEPINRQGGDTWDVATVITAIPHSSTGTTVGYTDDYDEVCPYAGSTAPDVVYSYAPGASIYVDISLCTNSDYDTKLYVYENTVPSTFYACNDDACTTPSYPSPYVSELVNILFTGGNTYYIVIDGYGGEAGNYTLDIIEHVYVEPPVNDECADAIPLTGPYPIQVSGTLAGATNDCPGLLDWLAVWYTIDLPYADNNVFIDWCDDPCDISTMGIVLMDDCLCDDYILATSSSWTCANGNGEMNFLNVAGPGTIYFPHYTLGCDDFVFNLDVLEATPCDVVCVGVPEGEEDCYDEYVDVTNGGCNSEPPVFGQIACNTTVCGTSGTFLFETNNYRDTDWFAFDIAEYSAVTWTVEAEFPVLIFLMDAGSGDCVDYTILADASGNPCDIVSVTQNLFPGTYWAWVGPSVFEGYACGLEYAGTLTCEVLPPEVLDCTGAVQLDCGMTVAGDNTLAPNNVTVYSCAPTWVESGGEVVYTLPIGGNYTSVQAELSNMTADLDVFILEACDQNTCVAVGDNLAYLPYPTMGHTYYIVVDGYEGALGTFDLTITCVECTVTCPGGTPEGEEDCYDEYVDVTNGGCNSEPPVFGQISCGETVCGTSGTYLVAGEPMRDTDWFQFTLSTWEFSAITLTAEAEFPISLFLVDATDCLAPIVLGFSYGFECEVTTLDVGLLPMGDYVAFIAPQVYERVPCGADYWMTLNCVQDFPPEGVCQPVHGPSEGWTAGTTDAGAGYLRAETFTGLLQPIADVQWWGLSLSYPWAECVEVPMPMQIKFYDDAAGLPGTETYSEDVMVTPVATGDLYAGFALYEFYVTLAAPVAMTDGWMSIQSQGTCWLLWMSSGTGDLSSGLYTGTWALDTFDLSYCLITGAPPCEPPVTAIAYSGGNTVLTMSGGDGTMFNIYKSPVPYDDGISPPEFVLVSSIPNGVGDDIWVDPAAGSWFYQVTSDCP